MGKASRWIVSLLLGKKDDEKDNYKKNSIKASSNCNCNPNHMHAPPTTPNTLKRRWSFGRSSRKEHKSPLILKNVEPVLLALPGVETASSSSSTLARNAAAIKIQSAFRSHLARRALCALRGLVKLQALARGHIVRKQTASTLHRMHALMTIQVRARLQRLVQINAQQVQGVDVISSKTLHPPARASFSFERQHYYADLTMSPDVPKYMVGTQSSRAKTAARSRSEPKQRPGWSIRHKTKSGNETGSVRLQLSSSHSNRMALQNDDPAWFVNLYESSTRSSSLDAYEPHLTLY